MPRVQLKIFLMSVSAVMSIPAIALEHVEKTGFIFRAERDIKAGEQVAAIAFGHAPMMLTQCDEEEAEQEGLRFAKRLMPEDGGWTRHAVVLKEIPRSTFIQMQLFTTAREIYDRTLRLIGFRPST